MGGAKNVSPLHGPNVVDPDVGAKNVSPIGAKNLSPIGAKNGGRKMFRPHTAPMSWTRM